MRSVRQGFHPEIELAGACVVTPCGCGSAIIVPMSWATSVGIRGRLTSTIPTLGQGQISPPSV
jgi:hypothetical protein